MRPGSLLPTWPCRLSDKGLVSYLTHRAWERRGSQYFLLVLLVYVCISDILDLYFFRKKAFTVLSICHIFLFRFKISSENSPLKMEFYFKGQKFILSLGNPEADS